MSSALAVDNLRMEDSPLLMSLDNKATLSYIFQQWLGEPLAATQPLREIQCSVECMYSRSEARFCTEDGMVSLFPKESGVAQGCLVSGWLFVVAFDSPVHMPTEAVAGNGIVRSCTDDVASACAGLRVVGRFAFAHGVIERATGLGIFLRKTVVAGGCPSQIRRYSGPHARVVCA